MCERGSSDNADNPCRHHLSDEVQARTNLGALGSPLNDYFSLVVPKDSLLVSA